MPLNDPPVLELQRTAAFTILQVYTLRRVLDDESRTGVRGRTILDEFLQPVLIVRRH